MVDISQQTRRAQQDIKDRARCKRRRVDSEERSTLNWNKRAVIVLSTQGIQWDSTT